MPTMTTGPGTRTGIALTVCLALLAVAGCSRNGEYRFVRNLEPLQPDLLQTVATRLRNSDFREEYDGPPDSTRYLTGHDEGVALKRSLDDAVVYVMLKGNVPRVADNVLPELRRALSLRLLQDTSGEQLLGHLDNVAAVLRQRSHATQAERLAALSDSLDATM